LLEIYLLCIYEILSLPVYNPKGSITIINFKCVTPSLLAKKTFPELSCVIVVRADIFDGASIHLNPHHYSLLNSQKILKKMLSINFNFSYINNISF
jgi:hypothetical protein